MMIIRRRRRTVLRLQLDDRRIGVIITEGGERRAAIRRDMCIYDKRIRYTAYGMRMEERNTDADGRCDRQLHNWNELAKTERKRETEGKRSDCMKWKVGKRVPIRNWATPMWLPLQWKANASMSRQNWQISDSVEMMRGEGERKARDLHEAHKREVVSEVFLQ